MQIAPEHTPVEFGQTDERVLRAHTELMQAVINGKSPSETARLLAGQLQSLSGVDRCTVYLRIAGSPDEMLRVIGSAGHEPTGGIEPGSIQAVAASWCGATDEPVVINDVEAEPDACDLVRRAGMPGVRSLLVIPLTLGSERVGIVLLANLELQLTSNMQGVHNVSSFLRLATHTICLAEQTLARRRELETSDTQKVALQRISGLVDNLERFLIAGASFSEFVNEAGKAINRRVWVLDPDGRMRASSESAIGPDLPKWLNGDRESSAVIRRGLMAARRGRPQMLEPQPALGLPLRTLLVPIMIGNDQWGTLVTTEHGRRFTRIDERLLRKAASYIALSHTSDTASGGTTRDIRNALALDLIRGTDPAERLERRAAREHIASQQSCAVVLVSPGSAVAKSDFPSMLEHLESAFQAAAGSTAPVLGCLVPEGLALIVPLSSRDGLASLTRAASAALHVDVDGQPRSDSAVAISDWADALTDLPRAYSEARQVLRCVSRYRSDERPSIMGASDLGVGAVLLASSDVTETRAFADAVLGRVLEQPGADDLIRTLHVFLTTSRRVRKCAQVLGIHENTVRYRLGRIDRVCGLNLMADSAHQSKAELALLVLRLTGTCPWDPTDDVLNESESLAIASEAV